MTELFKFDFDFLGNRIELQVLTYKEKHEVRAFFNEEKDPPSCFFGVYENKKYVVFQSDNFDKPYLYIHEFLHATKNILADFGVADEEMECYFLGYLAQTYSDFLEVYNRTSEEE